MESGIWKNYSHIQYRARFGEDKVIELCMACQELSVRKLCNDLLFTLENDKQEIYERPILLQQIYENVVKDRKHIYSIY